MPRKQSRRSVSLNREFHDAFSTWCQERGVSKSSVVERLVSSRTGIPIPPGHPRAPSAPLPMPPMVRRDLVTRERELHGRQVTEGEILDRAIVRFLDAVREPP